MVASMSEMEEPTPERSRFWIWFLSVILLLLLLVPVISIALAFKKSAMVPMPPRQAKPVAAKGAGEADNVAAQQAGVLSLRERVEQIAAKAIKAPTLKPKMQQVQIHAPPPAMNKAAESIHRVLWDRKEQFVEAMSQDSIKMVVILPSKDWPELSAALQRAAEKDGFFYRGPSQTSGSATSVDSMVAEIEILRKKPSVQGSRSK